MAGIPVPTLWADGSSPTTPYQRSLAQWPVKTEHVKEEAVDLTVSPGPAASRRRPGEELLADHRPVRRRLEDAAGAADPAVTQQRQQQQQHEEQLQGQGDALEVDPAALQQVLDAPAGPLLWAIEKRRPELLPALLAAGADPRSDVSGRGRLPLVEAAASGMADAVRLLLDSGAMLDQQDGKGYSALMAAAAAGHAELTSELLQRGAAADLRTPRGSLTALRLAAGKGHAAAVEQLLRHGGGPAALGGDGQLALNEAAAKGHTLAVETLIEHAEAARLLRESSTTALLLAAHHGDAAAVEQLLQGPAAAELQPAVTATALRSAAARGHAAVVARLARHVVAAAVAARPEILDGSNPRFAVDGCRMQALSAADSKGRSALLWAASRGHALVVEQLLEAGAATQNFAVRHETALSLAATQGHADVVAVLMRRQREPRASYELEAAANAKQANAVLALLRIGASLDRLPHRLLRHIIRILEQECQRGASLKPAALAAAVRGKHTAAMRVLLQAGAPLHGASVYYLSSIAGLLMKEWKELEWWAEAAPAMRQGGAAAAVKRQ